jgi:hypothetical protein
MTGIRGSEPTLAAEYLVVMQVLGRERGRERERMYKALDVEPAEIDTAISSLERAGVLTASPLVVRASPALSRLESLHLIGV